MTGDPTLDPGLSSWVPVPEGSDFPVQNLPFGVFSRGDDPPRVGVAIGRHAVDLTEIAGEGLLDGVRGLRAEVFASPALNGFLALGRPAWREVRERLSGLLAETDRRIRDVGGLAERALVPLDEATMHLPFQVGDYVDFYSSLEHAANLGRMLRPDADPLLPNWRHLPVGYHGRSATVVPSGTPIVRPHGQTKGDPDPAPAWGPSRMLDFELEVGFVTGPGNRLGEPIPVARASEHVFGLVLVNDWSARDIQRWEYQPLGPFLGKSFATSISPWVVTLDALEPYRVPGPPQEPEPLPYLRTDEPWGLDVTLEVGLASARMDRPAVLSRTSMRDLYWTIPQQLAHAASNGAVIRPGDLFASGTISGPTPDSLGSMMELSWRGTRPVELPDGSARTFLEDGDSVVMRGWCEAPGRPRLGFGEVRGEIHPAP